MLHSWRYGWALLVLLGTGASALAQSEVVGVRDRAGMFSKPAADEADAALRTLRDQTKWQVAIETIDKLDGKEIKDLTLANARKYQVHGLYVLLSKSDKKIHAEPSSKAESTFTKAKTDQIVKAFTDGLRAGKPDDGLKNAIAAIAKATGAATIAQAKPVTKQASTPSTPTRAGPTSADPTGVHDVAGMFSAEAVRTANEALKQFESKTKWHAVVETVPSLDGRDISEATRDHARKHEVRGVYVLIDRDGKKFHVEASKSASAAFDKDRVAAIVSALGAGFKAANFDDGLKGAVAEIAKVSASSVVAASPPPPRTPITKPTPSPTTSPAASGLTEKAQTPTPPVPVAETKRSGDLDEKPTNRATQPTPAPAPEPAPASPGLPKPLLIGGLILAAILGFWLLRKMFGGGSRAQQPTFMPANAPRPVPPGQAFGPAVGGQPMGGAAGPMMGGQPGGGYGPPPGGGYGPGYGPPPQAGGGMGGFVKGALGGVAGAVVGNILYDKFGRPMPAHGAEMGHHPTDPNAAGWPPAGTGMNPGAESYRPDAGAGGDWDTPVAPPPLPADEWGTGTGADGGWGTPPDQGAGADWGGDASGGGGGDWGATSEAAPSGGEWGGDGGGDTGGGGDWGGGDTGGGTDDQGGGGGW